MVWMGTHAGRWAWIALCLANCTPSAPPESPSGSEPEADSTSEPAAGVEQDAASEEAVADSGEDEPSDSSPSADAPAAAPAAPAESHCATFLATPKDAVLFAHESATIPKGEMPFLDGVAQAVRQSADGKVCLEVLGSADPSEADKAAWMSGTRARTVDKVLQEKGVPASRIQHVVGYGAEDAFKPDETCTELEKKQVRTRNRSAKVVQIPCP